MKAIFGKNRTNFIGEVDICLQTFTTEQKKNLKERNFYKAFEVHACNFELMQVETIIKTGKTQYFK
jgi:hypothetical protein